jgi:hypothetical protein
LRHCIRILRGSDDASASAQRRQHYVLGDGSFDIISASIANANIHKFEERHKFVVFPFAATASR